MMHISVRALAYVCFLGSNIAFAQEIVGAKADPAEIAIGSAAEIVIGFRSIQNNNSDSANPPSWRCGLSINYGDGKSEFHRIDDKQVPYKVIHKYDAPGNYAVTFEGKTQFQGFNSILSCSGQSRSVAVIVRPDDFAAREAAERTAKEDALKRAAADREAAERVADKAKEDRVAAERAAQKAATDRANASKRTPAARPGAEVRPAPVIPSKPRTGTATDL